MRVVLGVQARGHASKKQASHAQSFDQFLKFAYLALKLGSGAGAFESAVDKLNLVVPVHKYCRGVSEEMIDLIMDLLLDVVVVKATAE